VWTEASGVRFATSSLWGWGYGNKVSCVRFWVLTCTRYFSLHKNNLSQNQNDLPIVFLCHLCVHNILKRQLQLLVVDHSAHWSRKNAASCVNRCKMQDTPSTRHSNAHCSLGHTLASFVWASLICQIQSKDLYSRVLAHYSWLTRLVIWNTLNACHLRKAPVRVKSFTWLCVYRYLISIM
jgi:hypothetical protein